MTRHDCQRQALILQAQTLSVADTLFDHLPLGVTIWSPATQTPFTKHVLSQTHGFWRGKLVVKGTRIGVDLVLEELAHNPDITELLAAHPDLTRDDVQASATIGIARV